MSANLDRKKLVVAEIKEKVEKASSIVLVNYSGLDVENATELRKRFREAGAEYKVYKNNLVELAVKGTAFEAISKDLTGPNAFAFGFDDPVTPAKLVKDFIQETKKLELKSGVVEGEYCDVAKIEEIASLPSREALIGRFLGSVKAPISNFAYFLTNLAEKNEEVAEA
jgi:large subunit ribosomal protein L10